MFRNCVFVVLYTFGVLKKKKQAFWKSSMIWKLFHDGEVTSCHMTITRSLQHNPLLFINPLWLSSSIKMNGEFRVFRTCVTPASPLLLYALMGNTFIAEAECVSACWLEKKFFDCKIKAPTSLPADISSRQAFPDYFRLTAAISQRRGRHMQHFSGQTPGKENCKCMKLKGYT